MTRVHPGYDTGLTGKEKKYVILVEVEHCDQEHVKDSVKSCWKCGGFIIDGVVKYDTIETYNKFATLEEAKKWIDEKLGYNSMVIKNAMEHYISDFETPDNDMKEERRLVEKIEGMIKKAG